MKTGAPSSRDHVLDCVQQPDHTVLPLLLDPTPGRLSQACMIVRHTTFFTTFFNKVVIDSPGQFLTLIPVYENPISLVIK